MKPVDIGKAYNKIAHLWKSDNFDSNSGIEQHKRAIAFSKNKGAGLDVGCGCTGRFIDLLLDEGFEPEGVDVSDEMLKLAKTKHPDTTFYHEDICEWALPKTYDFITAWDSIWHVPLQQQAHVLTKLLSGLNSGGVFIFSCGGLNDDSEHTDDAMGEKVYYASLGISGFLKVIADAGCICRHMEYDQHPELHAYFIVQKP